MVKALYPGTFDPVTNGHLDVIGRAARLMDRLVIGVAINTGKGPLFSLDERVQMVTQETAHLTAIAEIEGAENIRVKRLTIAVDVGDKIEHL